MDVKKDVLSRVVTSRQRRPACRQEHNAHVLAAATSMMTFPLGLGIEPELWTGHHLEHFFCRCCGYGRQSPRGPPEKGHLIPAGLSPVDPVLGVGMPHSRPGVTFTSSLHEYPLNPSDPEIPMWASRVRSILYARERL